MAILMIPCSKLTDRWGRKRCFIGGLTIYGIGALVSAVSPNLGVLILGNSVLEGVGTALLIPGLALVGLGLGAMLTPSVNVVQSSFPEAPQGEISGCRGASPTSARRSAPQSPARSWSPSSPPATAGTRGRWSRSSCSA
jgi:MFS family permease